MLTNAKTIIEIEEEFNNKRNQDEEDQVVQKKHRLTQ